MISPPWIEQVSMRPRRAVRLPSLVAALFFLATVPASAPAQTPRGADWISRDAVAYVEITRPSEVLDRLTGDQVRAIVDQSPELRKSLESDGYHQAKGAVDAVAAALGTRWDRALLDMVGGGLVLAIEPASPPRAYLIATPLDPAFLARAQTQVIVLARLDAATKGLPDPVKSAEHRGITGYGLGPKAAYAIVDGTLVIADTGESLKILIDRSIDRLRPAESLAGDPLWQARRQAELTGAAAAWGVLRVDALRRLDPNALAIPAQVNPLATLLFGHWVEAARKAPWVSAGLTWTGERLGGTLTLATPPGGYSETFRRYVPAKDHRAPALALPPGTLACLSLRRDLATLWEVRSDLFSPEVVQGFAQLDTLAGTFFGGRDFGTGVLGALGTDWRLVVARQDFSKIDPVPDDKLPAFALVADLKPDDDEFAIRLKSAFQSFVGLANLNAAQTKAPPLMLASETLDGVTIATSRYLKPRPGANPSEPVNARHNFNPSAAQVGDHFILSSSLGLARDLIVALKTPAKPADATLVVAAEGAQVAALIEENRPKLVMQNMLEKGNDKRGAEAQVALLARIFQTLGRGSLSAVDTPEAIRFQLDFATGR